MSDPEAHDMQLQQSFPSGAQEWLCTTCKRRVVIEHGATRVKYLRSRPGTSAQSTRPAAVGSASLRARRASPTALPDPIAPAGCTEARGARHHS